MSGLVVAAKYMRLAMSSRQETFHFQECHHVFDRLALLLRLKVWLLVCNHTF